jgi:hypothetical protein
MSTVTGVFNNWEEADKYRVEAVKQQRAVEDDPNSLHYGSKGGVSFYVSPLETPKPSILTTLEKAEGEAKTCGCCMHEK